MTVLVKLELGSFLLIRCLSHALYMYVNTHIVYIYIRFIYVITYSYTIHTDICMHTHMHTYIHPCTYIYIYTIFVYTSICTYARVCVAVFLFLLHIRFMAKSSPPQPSCAAAQLLKSACCGQEVVAYLRCFCCFLRIASEVTNGLMQRLFCFAWPPICGHFPRHFG